MDKHSPIIRFSENSEALEIATLGDVANKYFVSNKGINHQNLLSLSYGQVVRKDIKGKKGLLPASYDTYQVIKDGIIVLRFTDLQNDHKSLRVGISHEEGIITSAYVCIEGNERIIPQYLYYLLTYKDLSKVFYSMGDGLRQTLNYKEAKTLPISIPSDKNEQTSISSLFLNLDTLILARQDELKKLRNLKKGMLERMFPKNGENKPEIRLAGFSGEWVSVPLSRIADKVIEKNLIFAYTEIFTNSAEFGVVSQLDFFDHDIANKNNINGYYVVREDNFVYNPRRSTTAPVGPFNRNKTGRIGVMSPLYTVFKVHDIDFGFLEWFFKSTYWYKFMFENGDSGARGDRFSIKDSTLLEMPVMCPTDKEEQAEVAKFFANLDNLIKAKEKQFEKLRNLKNGLLEKMFV